MENPHPVTIAIVDDHAMLRQAINMRLGLLGYKVVLEAENGQVFLDDLPKLPAPPDICLLDINMPVMDGFETATALKKNWPFVSKASQIGADGFLSKDASFEELKQALKKALKK
jgi:DNA-binding NarL/FixJ family response regulator